MKSILMAVDRASTRLGQSFAWLIVLLTCLIAWEVFSRYVLNSPHDWALDAQIQMYGTLFMLAGAYTLAKNGHVRGDVLYGFFQPRTQACPRALGQRSATILHIRPPHSPAPRAADASHVFRAGERPRPPQPTHRGREPARRRPPGWWGCAARWRRRCAPQ